jgi:hypothetical protein
MYVLEHYDGKYFVIAHENCNCAVGHVYRDGNRYRVTRSYVEGDINIATVTSPDEAIPVFAAHYHRHPPEWTRVNDAYYAKDTHFGGLDVRRNEQGAWVGSRGVDCLLLRDGKPATFATRQEAQRMADIHADDSYANSVPINDGYSWQVDPNVDEWLTVRGRARTSSIAAAAA